MYRQGRRYRKRSSIYVSRRRRRGPLKRAILGVFLVLAAAAVVFVGYSIEPTVRDLVTGKFKAPSSSAPAPAGSSSQTQPASSQAPAASSSAVSAAVRGITLPSGVLADTQTLSQTAAAAKAAGINLAVVTLKGEDGVVAYASKITEVQAGGIVAPGAPDASLAAKTLTQNGITPAARISCFRDPLAPQVMRDAAVLYGGDHSQRWLDANGNRWLNPYNQQAQQYIIDLAKEAVSLGYQQIYLDNLEFPLYDQKAWYGDAMPARADVLRSFVAEAKKQVAAAGGKLSVITPGLQAAGQGNPASGQDAGLYTFGSDLFSPNLSPSLLGLSVTLGSSALSKPDLTPGDTVAAEAAALKSLPGANADKTLPLIQAYTNAELGGGNFKTYTAADISAEIAALKAAGIGSFILTAPDGKYDFAGVTGLK